MSETVDEVYIPNEILFEIFSFLPVADLLNVTLISKKWGELSSTDGLWENVEFFNIKKKKVKVKENGKRMYIGWKKRHFDEKIRIIKLARQFEREYKKKERIPWAQVVYWTAPILCLSFLFVTVTLASISLSWHNRWYMYLIAFLTLAVGFVVYLILCATYVLQQVKWARIARNLHDFNERTKNDKEIMEEYIDYSYVKYHYFFPVATVIVGFIFIFIFFGVFLIKGIFGSLLNSFICFIPVFLWTVVYLAVTVYVFVVGYKLFVWSKQYSTLSWEQKRKVYWLTKSGDLSEAVPFFTSFVVVFNIIYLVCSTQLVLLGFYFEYKIVNIWITLIPSFAFFGVLGTLLSIIGMVALFFWIVDKTREKHIFCDRSAADIVHDGCLDPIGDYIKTKIFKEALNQYNGWHSIVAAFLGLFTAAMTVLSIMCIPIFSFVILLSVFIYFDVHVFFSFIILLFYSICCCFTLPFVAMCYVTQDTKDKRIEKRNKKITGLPPIIHPLAVRAEEVNVQTANKIQAVKTIKTRQMKNNKDPKI